MKQGIHAKLGRSLAVCLLAALAAAAQEPAERLSLRLTPYDGAKPSYFPVGDGTSPASMSVDFLRRLKDAAPAQGGELFRALNFNVGRRGERLVVRLSLSREIDEAADVIQLGEYAVGAGEELSVEGLARYGFEPVRLAAVGRPPVKLAQPPVVNLTRSIAVLGVETLEPSPQLELTLKNVSGRNVMAVELRLTKGGAVKAYRSDTHAGERPWALPGGVWKSKLGMLGARDDARAGGHFYEQPDEIVVASVLFSDGGYEGDVGSAARDAALNLGRRVRAERGLSLIRGWEEPEGEGATDAARELWRRVKALSVAFDEALVDDFMGRYPELPASERERMKGLIADGLKGVRTELLSGLKPFTEGGHAQAGPRQLREWLTRMRAKYERILSVY